MTSTHRRPAVLLPLIAAALLVALPAQRARADAGRAERRIPIAATSGAHRIVVHPAYVTVLDFPSPIVRVVRSDATHFTIEATDRRVFLRPLEEAAPGTVANLHVITEQALVTVLLHVAEHPADAVAHVAFTAAATEPPTPPTPRHLSLAAGATLGAVALGGGDRFFTGGLEAGLAYPTSRTGSLLACAAVSRGWYTTASIPPVADLPMDTSDLAIATVQSVRLLGGYRLHRGARLRVHGSLLTGVQYWSLDEAARLIEAPSSGSPTLIASARSFPHIDGVLGAELGLARTVWQRWRAGLGVRALHAWRIGAPAFDAVEGWLSLQWQ
jgi:hypothetical protein